MAEGDEHDDDLYSWILRDAVERHMVDVRDGVYSFPYKQAAEILKDFGSAGLGAYTQREILDRLTGEHPIIRAMIGLHELEPLLANARQSSTILKAARRSGVDKSVLMGLAEFLAIEPRDDDIPELPGSEDIEPIFQKMEAAGFENGVIDRVAHYLGFEPLIEQED